MSINRRTFLKGSIASGLTLAAPTIIRAQAGRKYRTALIGCGWWGMNIARTAVQSGLIISNRIALSIAVDIRDPNKFL